MQEQVEELQLQHRETLEKKNSAKSLILGSPCSAKILIECGTTFLIRRFAVMPETPLLLWEK
jgi:hypothetical protein